MFILSRIRLDIFVCVQAEAYETTYVHKHYQLWDKKCLFWNFGDICPAYSFLLTDIYLTVNKVLIDGKHYKNSNKSILVLLVLSCEEILLCP